MATAATARGLAFVAFLSAAACSGDDGATAEASTVSIGATTTTQAPTSTTEAGPACPGPPLGDAVDEAASIDGADVDGDGSPDVVTSYLVPEEWRLRVDVADGGAAETVLTTALLDNAHVETATDLDGDGRDEVWVVVGNGASTTIMGLYRLDGCELEPIMLEGTAAQFGVGGPVLLLQGLRCEDGRIVHLGATSEDGETFATLDLVYELHGSELVRVDDRSGQLTSSDPDLQAYASFDC